MLHSDWLLSPSAIFHLYTGLGRPMLAQPLLQHALLSCNSSSSHHLSFSSLLGHADLSATWGEGSDWCLSSLWSLVQAEASRSLKTWSFQGLQRGTFRHSKAYEHPTREIPPEVHQKSSHGPTGGLSRQCQSVSTSTHLFNLKPLQNLPSTSLMMSRTSRL